ncbi:MAG: RNA polymerase sigma factor [Ktedonobacteraceae bacterium]
MDQLSDEVLMGEVMAGKTMALAMLVERYHAPLLGYLYRLARGDRPLAEDLVQETFLNVLQQRSYQSGRPFKPWLYAIATNRARDHFKSVAARCFVRQVDDEDDVPGEFDVSSSPEAILLAWEQGDEINAMLNRLSEEYRITLLLRFYQGMSLQEIADTLHVPLGTVKSRLSVGTRQLRKLLSPMKERVE